MTLKQKALIETICLLLTMIGISILVNLVLFYTPLIVLQYMFLTFAILFFIKIVYDVVLARLESNERLKNKI